MSKGLDGERVGSVSEALFDTRTLGVVDGDVDDGAALVPPLHRQGRILAKAQGPGSVARHSAHAESEGLKRKRVRFCLQAFKRFICRTFFVRMLEIPLSSRFQVFSPSAPLVQVTAAASSQQQTLPMNSVSYREW